MELLEYQAKELFRMVEIPTLPSQTIADSRQIKQLRIPYPVVLKSQVRSGGRGKAGGVRFVANTIDAIAAARTIFNLAILGEYPEVILAEAHYNTQREFFLAIVLDYDLQCPVLLGSALGGMNVDSLLANLQQVAIDDDFSPYYARRLAASMGLSGQLICSVSEIIAKMYRLFRERDLNLIEINPLGVNTKGELMALDGKIAINDSALARQPIINSLNFSEYQKQNKSSASQNKDYFNKVGWHWLDWQHKTGKIATICNSFDLALLTWDLLSQSKATPACSVVINDNFSEGENGLETVRDRLRQILRELESIKGLKVILLDIWSSEAIARETIDTIAEYIQSSFRVMLHSQAEELEEVRNSASKSEPTSSLKTPTSTKSQPQKTTQDQIQVLPKFVLRLPAQNNLTQINLNSFLDSDLGDYLKVEDTLYVLSDLETAIKQAISLV